MGKSRQDNTVCLMRILNVLPFVHKGRPSFTEAQNLARQRSRSRALSKRIVVSTDSTGQYRIAPSDLARGRRASSLPGKTLRRKHVSPGTTSIIRPLPDFPIPVHTSTMHAVLNARNVHLVDQISGQDNWNTSKHLYCLSVPSVLV